MVRRIVATPMAALEAGGGPSLSCSAPGTFKTGQILTCNDGVWSGRGLTITRQWQRDLVNIGGQTGQTYTLVVADETKKINCIVTATPSNPHLTAKSVSTPQTITITP